MDGSLESARYVLDAYALMAFIHAEPGAERVRELLHAADAVELSLTTVNLAEVLYRVERDDGEAAADAVLARLTQELPVHVVEADLDLSVRAARFKAVHPASLADCYAVALAERLDAVVVTGDPDFRRFEGRVAVEWLPAPQ